MLEITNIFIYFYNVIFEFTPIGSPIKYQTIIITIQVNESINIDGIIFFIVPSILTFESLSYLYISPIVIIKYKYIGENNFPTESAAINIVCVNEGEIFARINSGTNIGPDKLHLTNVDGINIDINTTTKNINITSNIPVILLVPIKSTIFKDITSNTFVQSIITYNTDVKNNNTNTYPDPSNVLESALL